MLSIATLTLTPITILTPLTLTRLAKLLAKKVAELSVTERSDLSDLDLVTSTGFFNALQFVLSRHHSFLHSKINLHTHRATIEERFQ